MSACFSFCHLKKTSKRADLTLLAVDNMDLLENVQFWSVA